MIVLKDIDFTLDPESIEKAIQSLEAFERNLGNAMAILLQKLGEKGAEIARAELLAFDRPAVDTGELLGSIFYNSIGKDEVVVATGVMYALFVEYGTGIIGKSAPHPEPNGYAYDVNNHGVDGWVYRDSDGMFHRTLGMESRPFMFNTLRQLEVEAEANGARIIAEYIL